MQKITKKMSTGPFHARDKQGRTFREFAKDVYSIKQDQGIPFDRGSLDFILFNVHCGLGKVPSIQIAAREGDVKSRILDTFGFYLPDQTPQTREIKNIGEVAYTLNKSELVESRVLFLGQMFPGINTNMIVNQGKKRNRIVAEQKIKQNNYSLDKINVAGFDDINKAEYNLIKVFNLPQSEFKNEILRMRGEKIRKIINNYFDQKQLNQNLRLFKEYISYLNRAPYSGLKQTVGDIVYKFVSAFEKGIFNTKEFITGLAKEFSHIKAQYKNEITKPYKTEKKIKKDTKKNNINAVVNSTEPLKSAVNGMQNTKALIYLGETSEQANQAAEKGAGLIKGLTYGKDGRETYIDVAPESRKRIDIKEEL